MVLNPLFYVLFFFVFMIFFAWALAKISDYVFIKKREKNHRLFPELIEIEKEMYANTEQYYNILNKKEEIKKQIDNILDEIRYGGNNEKLQKELAEHQKEYTNINQYVEEYYLKFEQSREKFNNYKEQNKIRYW